MVVAGVTPAPACICTTLSPAAPAASAVCRKAAFAFVDACFFNAYASETGLSHAPKRVVPVSGFCSSAARALDWPLPMIAANSRGPNLS